jgi:CRISPR-associated protein Csx10
MSIQLSFRISIRSDYHISAGHGIGAVVDSALQRDADGLPVLRGTAIAGLLRDGLRDLGSTPPVQASARWQQLVKTAENLVNDGPGGWEPSAALFGAPSQPKRWQISSGRPVNLAKPQDTNGSGWRMGGLGGQAAAHVRVHPALRRAEARKLFVREEGDQRLEFDFTATCPQIDEQAVAEAALLVAAARMIRHLGAGRRRGRGECSIHLQTVSNWPGKLESSQPDEKALLATFEDYWLMDKPLTGIQVPQPAEVSLPSRTGQILRLVMAVRTDEPVLIAQRAEAGNQFDSLGYIPGFVLRGALASLLAARHDLSDAFLHQLFTRLFFRGAVQFSSLLPVFEQGRVLYPAIPSPQDLFVSELHPGKGELIGRHTVLNGSAAAHGDFKDTQSGRDLKLEPLSGWLAVRDKAEVVKADRSSEMHVTMNPETGRAKDQELFGYVTIAAGQYFLGEILFQDSSDWVILQKLIGLPDVPPVAEDSDEAVGQSSATFEVRVGKATRRGYGLLTCTLFQAQNPGHSLWAGQPLKDRVMSVQDPLTLTLLSDAIVLDPWGRSYQGFDESWVSQALGVKVRIASEKGATSGIEHSLQFARGRIVDTFNNHIGLPRHRDIALVAGSAVTLLVDEDIELDALHDRLAKAEMQGIGLRRHEGFGRLVFDHPVYENACQAVGDVTGIRAPNSLQRGKAHHDDVLASEARFQNGWKDSLRFSDEDRGKLRHEELDGLVREIRTARIQSLADATALLVNYGKAEAVMPGGMPGRQKPSFFGEQGQGEAGLRLLISLFERLSRSAGASADRWTIGCAMLAEQLALIVPEKKEK